MISQVQQMNKILTLFFELQTFIISLPRAATQEESIRQVHTIYKDI